MWIELEWEAQWNTICQVDMNEQQVTEFFRKSVPKNRCLVGE